MTETGDRTPAPDREACDCKVGSVSEAYGLQGTLAELEARWTGPAEERESVRSLTRTFNEAVLRAALRDATAQTSDVSALYRQLTDDDVSSGTRTAVRRRLGREGVPVEAVEERFVSHQSLYLHLTDCRQLSYERSGSDGDRPERARSQLMALRERMVLVTEDKLDRLDANGLISAESVSVLVDVDVFCEACDTSYSLDRFLREEGCECSSEPASSD